MTGDDSAAVAGWGRSGNEAADGGDIGELVTNSTRQMHNGGGGKDASPASGKKGSGGGARRSSSKNKLPSIAKKSAGGGRKTSAGAGGAKKGGRAASVASGTSKKSGKSGKSGKSSKSSGKRGGGKKKGSGSGGSRKPKILTFNAKVEMLEDLYCQERNAIEAEEEFELQNFSPIYNALVMEMVRVQVEQMNLRQRKLNEAVNSLRDGGIPIADDDTVEAITEKLRYKMKADADSEMQQLRNENAALRDRLENKALELEKKVADVEVLRQTIARKIARTEVDNENMRAQVTRGLQSATLDIERMKKELTRRIEVCCSSIRTPKYGTALRSMQDLTVQVQEEVQAHHDLLCKLVISIGAKDTFKKSGDDPSTMHTNFPAKYREDLRKLNKDHLLNVMDVLSFQDGVVETVGKALFVLNEGEYQTDVV